VHTKYIFAKQTLMLDENLKKVSILQKTLPIKVAKVINVLNYIVS